MNRQRQYGRYVCTLEYYSPTMKNEILSTKGSFSKVNWLEDIMLNKTSQISKTRVHIPFLMQKLSKVYLDVEFENGTAVIVGKGGCI